MSDIGGKTWSTGVLDGGGNAVTYEDLVELIDKDETAERDIQIGYKNVSCNAKDLDKSIDEEIAPFN